MVFICVLRSEKGVHKLDFPSVVLAFFGFLEAFLAFTDVLRKILAVRYAKKCRRLARHGLHGPHGSRFDRRKGSEGLPQSGQIGTLVPSLSFVKKETRRHRSAGLRRQGGAYVGFDDGNIR